MINRVWEATWAATELKNARLAVLSLVWRVDSVLGTTRVPLSVPMKGSKGFYSVLLPVAKFRAAGMSADR